MCHMCSIRARTYARHVYVYERLTLIVPRLRRVEQLGGALRADVHERLHDLLAAEAVLRMDIDHDALEARVVEGIEHLELARLQPLEQMAIAPHERPSRQRARHGREAPRRRARRLEAPASAAKHLPRPGAA